MGGGGNDGPTTNAHSPLPSSPRRAQIQPDHDIIIEFIRNEDYKYVRLLGAGTQGQTTHASLPTHACIVHAKHSGSCIVCMSHRAAGGPVMTTILAPV